MLVMLIFPPGGADTVYSEGCGHCGCLSPCVRQCPPVKYSSHQTDI